jgi:hypothetical protein
MIAIELGVGAMTVRRMIVTGSYPQISRYIRTVGNSA